MGCCVCLTVSKMDWHRWRTAQQRKEGLVEAKASKLPNPSDIAVGVVTRGPRKGEKTSSAFRASATKKLRLKSLYGQKNRKKQDIYNNASTVSQPAQPKPGQATVKFVKGGT